nr:hypothetical protein [uncultured Kingella sp.]
MGIQRQPENAFASLRNLFASIFQAAYSFSIGSLKTIPPKGSLKIFRYNFPLFHPLQNRP